MPEDVHHGHAQFGTGAAAALAADAERATGMILRSGTVRRGSDLQRPIKAQDPGVRSTDRGRVVSA